VIQNVEEFRPELQRRSFAQPEILVDAQIPLFHAGRAKRIAPQIAERRVRRRGSERVSREVCVQHRGRTLAGRAARYIGTLESLTAIIIRQTRHVVGRRWRVGDVDGHAGVRCVDRVELPPARERLQDRVQAGAELPALAERKLIHHAGDVDELYVKARRAALRCQIANVLGV